MFFGVEVAGTKVWDFGNGLFAIPPSVGGPACDDLFPPPLRYRLDRRDDVDDKLSPDGVITGVHGRSRA